MKHLIAVSLLSGMLIGLAGLVWGQFTSPTESATTAPAVKTNTGIPTAMTAKLMAEPLNDKLTAQVGTKVQLYTEKREKTLQDLRSLSSSLLEGDFPKVKVLYQVQAKNPLAEELLKAYMPTSQSVLVTLNKLSPVTSLCRTCGGTRKVYCSDCEGVGLRVCSTCSSKDEVNSFCSECGGKYIYACKACGGTGFVPCKDCLKRATALLVLTDVQKQETNELYWYCDYLLAGGFDLRVGCTDNQPIPKLVVPVPTEYSVVLYYKVVINIAQIDEY